MNENCLNMRCRIQRLSDLKLFAGWIDIFDFPRVQIRLARAKVNVLPGQELRVEIFCTDRKVCFNATVQSCNGQLITLEIGSPIQYTNSIEDARFYVEPVYGSIESSGARLPVVVVDASEQGMGMIVGVPIEKNLMVNIGIENGRNKFKCMAEIRYCREMKEEPGKYRCGIMIQSMTRIDRARYLEMMHKSQIEGA